LTVSNVRQAEVNGLLTSGGPKRLWKLVTPQGRYRYPISNQQCRWTDAGT